MPTDSGFPEEPVMDAYLSGLNPPQRLAVETTEGPLLVLAGAGTGKTRVLTSRIAHLLMTHRAYPQEILATTFTNKAAREMRERVESMAGASANGLWLGTFHSLAVKILRRHAELMGLSSRFTIIDTDDQIRLLKQLIQEQGIDDKKFPPRLFMSIIQRWKDRGLVPDKVKHSDGAEGADGMALTLYREYQRRLAQSDAVDFGDLTMHNLTLFSEHSDILAQYSQRFRYILVDEYQDTNVAQYLWLRLLAMGHKNICCVGDDDQSIYGWRGAEVGNILRFEQDFPGAQVIKLEQNYRSTPHILGAAARLITHNQNRHGKTLWSAEQTGEKVAICSVWDDKEEARHVGEEIEALQRAGGSLAEIAILVRAGFQTRAFEEQFMSLGIPYRVIGGLRFYERQEIRDILAYLRVTVQPNDDLAFTRIVNLPRRGVGKSTLDKAQQAAREQGVSLYRAIADMLAAGIIKGKAATGLQTLLDSFSRWHSQLETLEPAELVDLMLEESGYRAMWQQDRSPEAPGRLENLKELLHAIAEFEDLPAFLDHVGLVMDTDSGDDQAMVNLMTLHAAKGLEFDHVFLPGWEEGLFPHQRSLDESGAKGLEEERRLAHVGLTRARKRAWILHAGGRRIYNQWQHSLPSRFISELPEEHIEQHRSASLGGQASGPRWNNNVEDIMERAQQRYGSRNTSTAPTTARPSSNNGAFPVACRVFNQKYGYGKVISAQDGKLEVCFEKAGIKKVMEDYVTRA